MTVTSQLQVPLLDLKAQYAGLREEMTAAVEEVLESQIFINGPKVRELEEAIARQCDCAGAVGVSSGTDALLCALMVLGIGPGDEVITTPYSFFATAGSIWRTGARPVFVDIDPETFNIDVSRIEAAITSKTKAVMPVHLFGQTADLDPIVEICRRRELHLIEDAAQAIGSTYRGRQAGSIGTIGCFSFFPTKNLGGLGDGGIVTSQDPELLERLYLCRNHGATRTYFHSTVGGNFRLDALQAAGLLVKLPHLESWSAGRRANAALYDSLFEGAPGITTPTVREHNVSIYNQYAIRVQDRDALLEHLREVGIGCAIYYPLGLHQQECFAELGYRAGDFPETERAAATSLALPIYSELTEEQIRQVGETVRTFVSARLGD